MRNYFKAFTLDSIGGERRKVGAQAFFPFEDGDARDTSRAYEEALDFKERFPAAYVCVWRHPVGQWAWSDVKRIGDFPEAPLRLLPQLSVPISVHSNGHAATEGDVVG